MTELVSVIIPVYNTGNFLPKCIKSVLEQTYSNLEIIIIDDGSDYETFKVCDDITGWDERVRVIHKENGGLSSARNAGLDIASGTYISFLDSDDYLSPSFVEDLLSITADGVLPNSHFVRVKDNGEQLSRDIPHIEGGVIPVEAYLEELLLHRGDVSVCTKLFHRNIIGASRFDTTRLNEDLLFMISILPNINSVAFTDKIGYFYLCRAGSLSSHYGKAFEDMVKNSIVVKDYVIQNRPSLSEQAWRFSLFQHMAYLLWAPSSARSMRNSLYGEAVSFLRWNFFSKGLNNKYITLKQKCIMLGLCMFPRTLSIVFHLKNHI